MTRAPIITRKENTGMFFILLQITNPMMYFELVEENTQIVKML